MTERPRRRRYRRRPPKSGSCADHQYGQLQFVDAVPEDFICQICMKVLQEPHVTECCGQHYCKACLEKWFTQSGNCPHCRETGFRHILYKPYQRKINDLQIICPNLKRGCPITLRLGDLELHLSATNASGCAFIDIICPNQCGASYYRKDEMNHLNIQCTKRIVNCEYCYNEVTFDSLKDHFKECKKYPIPCPRQCQAMDLTREDLTKHEEECPNMPVKCPFYEAGCDEELKRKNLKSHVKSSFAVHMMKSMAKLKNELDELKAALEYYKRLHRL